MQNSKSKTAFISGGSRGLGKSAALSIAQKGHDVIFSYVQNREAAEATQKAIEALGQKAAFIQLDVGQINTFENCRQAIQSILETWDKTGLDFLVNNAGIGAHMTIGNGQEAIFDQLMNIQFKGDSSIGGSLEMMKRCYNNKETFMNSSL